MKCRASSSARCMRFSELDGRTVGVWGAGREIRSFARHLRERLPSASLAVVVMDGAGTADLDAPVVAASDAVEALRGCDAVVRSPGVSIYRPELQELLAAGVPVTTATGLWLAERGGARVIGVTGTKGKSTTATLIAHLARAAGEAVSLAGNIGRPALDLIGAPPSEWAVVELSSYQIADLAAGPQVAVLTNLYREHADWHGSEEAYRRDKLRLLRLPGVEACVALAGLGLDGCAGFGAPGGWHAVDGAVVDGSGAVRIAAPALPLRGEHNALNACAALAALEAAGIAVPPLPEALDGLQALPHRLQTVASAGGVEWVDDSISTTPESALAALSAFAGRDVILVAGGSDRGQDYGVLGEVAASRGVTVLGLPATGARVVGAARAAGAPAERAFEVDGMETAVAEAARRAAPGTVVLLSPAAPSFTAYRDFEERGDHFAALARRA
jgi:UDP-N-acetylmuramoylalanine-D-glutamate ligase